MKSKSPSFLKIRSWSQFSVSKIKLCKLVIPLQGWNQSFPNDAEVICILITLCNLQWNPPLFLQNSSVVQWSLSCALLQTFHYAVLSSVSRVCCDSTMFPLCVLSAHLCNFKHIDSQTPDTAGCHVWRACAWRLTAQGYLKGCANFALFIAPINSVYFCGSLCAMCVVDVSQSMVNMLPCCLAFVFAVCLNRLYWCELSPVTSCLMPVSLGAAMSQFSTMTTRERKMQAAAICREIQAQEGSHIYSPSSKSLRALRFSLFLLLHSLSASVYVSSSSLILLHSAPWFNIIT